MTLIQSSNRRVWLGLVVSLLSLAAILWLIDLNEVGQAFLAADYRYLLITLAGLAAFLFLRAFRWRLLLGGDVTYASVFHIQNIGYLLSMLLPLRIGDLARAVLIGRQPTLNILQGASTMVVERLFDLLFFVALFPFTLAGLPRLPETLRQAALISGIVSAGGIFVLVLIASRRSRVEGLLDRLFSRPGWRERVGQLLDGLSALSSWRSGAGLLLWSLAVWLPIGLAYDAGLRAVGLSLSPLQVGFVICCAAFGVALPSSPGQLGVFHAAVFFAIATALGYPTGPALSFALLYHAAQYVVFVGLGAWGFTATGISWQGALRAARQEAK